MPNDSLTVFMKIGILEPPPINSIAETSIAFYFIDCDASLKNCFSWFIKGEIISSNYYLFMVKEISQSYKRHSMLKSYSEFPDRILRCFSIFCNSFIVAFLLYLTEI